MQIITQKSPNPLTVYWRQVGVLCVTSFVVFCFCFSVAFSDEQAMKILADACRTIGKDRPDISTLYIEFERTTVYTNVSKELVENKSSDIQKMHEQYLARMTDPKMKEKLEKTLSSKNTFNAVNTHYSKAHKSRNRYWFFQNNHHLMLKTIVTSYNDEQKKWDLDSIYLLERPVFLNSPEHLPVQFHFKNDVRQGFLNNSVLSSLDTRLTGRMRGFLANTSFELLSESSPQSLESQITTNLGVPVIIKRQIEYDKGSFATEIELKKSDNLVARLWIDSSRGFVCPLIQFFDIQTKKKNVEIRSSH